VSHGTETLRRWLTEAVRNGASDLHLVAGHPPVLRVHGNLQSLDEPLLVDEQLRPILNSICPGTFVRQFEKTGDVDFSLEMTLEGNTHRFRVNAFVADQKVGACFRLIPGEIPGLEWAGFPRDVAERLVDFRNGLVLVTGVTGSGKSTTLAMLVQLLNARGNSRIITIEEPVEYRYPAQPGSVVTQREVGLDVESFAAGLKHGLRQDPDVILIGEIRDKETAQNALTAAETGHLVLSTLHTRDAKGAISRYADVFPQSVQNEVRSQLALCLRAIVSQHLLPNVVAGERRALALEIMFANSPIASAIRTGKLTSIDNYILTGRSEGMVTLDESVKALLYSGQIDHDVAERFVSDPASLF
jgi:twitching motility protein PilT